MKKETIQQPQDTSTPEETTSIPVKDELDITKGEWVVEPFGKAFQIMSGDIGERSHIATLFTATMDNSQQQPSNAKAICTAVNSTYGKNLNPAAMEELYKALEGLCKEIHLGKLNIKKDFSLINAHAYANKVLHNAKTIKP